ncbi:hypothetical protein QYF36_011707 [Acer negundo]|nr:hypothetical protein QYF36_011707 [Acer negundo]
MIGDLARCFSLVSVLVLAILATLMMVLPLVLLSLPLSPLMLLFFPIGIVYKGGDGRLASRTRSHRCPWSQIFFSCLGDTEHFLCLKSAKNKSEFFFFRFRKQQGGNSLNI